VALTCRLLSEDVELAAVVPEPLLEQALASCVAPVIKLPRGTWTDVGRLEPAGLGLLVRDGLLIRRVGIEGRYGAELLGEGDLLRPWRDDRSNGSVDRVNDWRVTSPSRLAVLGDSVTRRITAYPELVVELVDRTIQRSRTLAANIAILHQIRVEARLELILWMLADRWGKVGPDGVRLPLRLTHEVLGEMVAARRPTVSSTLGELARSGRIISTREGWLLRGDPPGELIELKGSRSGPSRPRPVAQR
jgi:CRP/FNR family transcriptional regulator, cyclic AMP receptor protein